MFAEDLDDEDIVESVHRLPLFVDSFKLMVNDSISVGFLAAAQLVLHARSLYCDYGSPDPVSQTKDCTGVCHSIL